MPDNEDTAPPALPFDALGSPTAASARLLAPGTTTDFTSGASVTDITNLIGAKLFEKISIRGTIGTNSPSFNVDSQVDRVRQPWVLTCQKWIQEGRYIISAVNPKDVTWRMPQRSAPQKTRIGEILHVWKDRFRGTFYDEPQISINFQSGNIMPIRQKDLIKGGVSKKPQFVEVVDEEGNRRLEDGGVVFPPRSRIDTSETKPDLPRGLGNFYEFLSLVDEQKILDDENNKGDINYVYIMYNSRIFPNITLAGLFTPEGVSWTDSSDDPNQVTNWNANFTIYDSYPRLHDLNTLVEFFQNSGFGRV